MNELELNLTGTVGFDAFSADFIDYTLGQHSSEKVTVYISSFGGYINDALRIAAAFRKHGDVTVHYSGMNASAATIIGMGAKHVRMESSAFWLIHNASTFVDVFSRMNADALEIHLEEIRSQIANLKTLDEGVAALYASRCNKTPAELSSLMNEERWMTATEAKEWGFVDEIVETARKTVPQSVVMAISEAGLPEIPGIEKTKQSFTARIKSALMELFKDSLNSQSNMEDKKTTEETPAVETPAVKSAAEKPEAEANADLEALRSEIANLKKDIETKDAKIASLEKRPGATTSTVVDTKNEKRSTGAVDTFTNDLNEAKKLFSQLP